MENVNGHPARDNIEGKPKGPKKDLDAVCAF